MHVTLNYDQFKWTVEDVKTKWNQYTSLNEFSLYFFKEWLYHNNEWSRWSRWQLFQRPVGVACTNNPIESYNKQIKSVYTNYEVYSVYQFLLIIMHRLINQSFYQPKQLKFYREPSRDMINEANIIANDESSFLQQSNDSFWYKNLYVLHVQNNLSY